MSRLNLRRRGGGSVLSRVYYIFFDGVASVPELLLQFDLFHNFFGDLGRNGVMAVDLTIYTKNNPRILFTKKDKKNTLLLFQRCFPKFECVKQSIVSTKGTNLKFREVRNFPEFATKIVF